LNREVTVVLQNRDLRTRLEALSFATVTGSPAQFRTLIRDEHARWGTVIREVGLKLE
jgi:tripartite-type tricarboxylate transporter receptor subunit TctC